MKNKIFSVFLISVSFIFFSSCKTSFDAPKYSEGNADFTNYVSLGDAFTAGFQDGALFADGQKNSFPALLCQQFKHVSDQAEFNIPYVTGDDATLGVSPYPTMLYPQQTYSKLILAYSSDCAGMPVNNAVNLAPPNTSNSNFYTSNVYVPGKAFHNLGVPGAKSFDLLNQTFGGSMTLGGNPFYKRFASVPGTSTLLDDALIANPTFFTLWIGNTDVMTYAISGGAGIGSGGLNYNDITPVDTFVNAVNSITDKLTVNGAKGAIGNIPDISVIPFFTTIPFNGLNLKNQAQADSLNLLFDGYNANAQIAGLPQIVFIPGNNAYVMHDTAAKYQPVQFMRQMKQGELVLLSVPSDSIKCYGMGTTIPIPENFVLDAAEIVHIKTATTNFNASLKSKASQKNLCYVDLNSYFKTLNAGVKFNGQTFNTEYITGGAFSLDGVNPNMRGYALIANFWIQNINTYYKSTLPLLDVNAYPGITLP